MKRIGLIITSIVILFVLAITIFAYLDSQDNNLNIKDKKMIGINKGLATLDITNEIKKTGIDDLKNLINESNINIQEGFCYVDNKTNALKIAITKNENEKDADKVFFALLNIIKEANIKEKESGESFLNSNVVLKRVHIDNNYYTYLIISPEHEKIESIIKQSF